MATYGSKQYLLFELMFCCIFDTNLLFEIVFFPNIQNNIFYLKGWDLWVDPFSLLCGFSPNEVTRCYQEVLREEKCFRERVTLGHQDRKYWKTVVSVNKAFQIEDIEHIFGGMF